jgi:hypothetical protein
MDPRTDSFLALKQGREKEQDLPPFNSTQELLPENLIWILDEVLRLEVCSFVRCVDADVARFR